MLKKILVGTLAFLIINTSAAYADEVKNKDDTKENTVIEEDATEKLEDVKIVKPKNNLITVDRNVVLSGKGEEGTEIVVEVYSAKNVTEIEFDVNTLLDTKDEDEYVLVSSENFKIGKLGYFAHELKLNLGKNKITLYVKENEEVKKVLTRHVVVTEISKAKEYINNINNMNFSDKIKEMIGEFKKFNDGQ
ncbi:hypothetical protein [Thermohalobacter berrensis]|uniref:Uncharacterized protein n=1 Tax=Thermohalobacter berrensis TaxID=99594 RepID=A0A419T3T9_9FIRM|nr:hypothetical protein [Thermohalobacter berrensis]RKD32099.1 hypothetical protein BET03_11555 [Thermohalobacter berrensis]